jgi:hypothetical protein
MHPSTVTEAHQIPAVGAAGLLLVGLAGVDVVPEG